MIGSLDHVTRRLIVHTSPTKRSTDFIAHLGNSIASTAQSRDAP